MRKLFTVTIVVLLISGGAVRVRAADSLAAARDLYAAAEYDQALALLERMQAAGAVGATEQRGIEQYRAFCLIALGKPADAEKSIAAMIAADPLDRGASSEMSPRVQTAFREVRRRILPGLVQERYRSAKAAFDAKDFATATAAFDVVLKAMADPDVEAAVSQPPLSDLRMLAAGFYDLSKSNLAPPPLVAATQAPPAAVVPVVALPPRVYSVDDRGIVPPAVVRQSVPSMPPQLRANGPGILELLIDETGAVESVAMRQSVNPRYDVMLLDAAKRWSYQPAATLQGVPVKYRKMVQIEVQKP